MPRLFYCTAIVDEDSDGVVTYYAFCFKGQPAAEYSANNEEDADWEAADDSADESNIASSQTGGAMNDAAMAGVGNIAGILAAAALPLSHN